MADFFEFDIDPKFREYFQGRLKQVFLYITDECNLLCAQCLCKPNIVFHMRNAEIPVDTALALIKDFKTLGASKLSILGGEPSLYGASEDHEPLMKVINEAKQRGYKHIRMDTNGQFDKGFLDLPGLKLLDEISFSLDGHKPEVHDILRGEGTFQTCISNIKQAINQGYHIAITTCVHRKLIRREESGNYALDELIRFVGALGVKEINFHILFKHGFPMDTWTGETDIPWHVWTEVFLEMKKKIKENEYALPVRIPQHFITETEFRQNPEYYGYCAAKLGERILAHPNGMLRICSGLICSQYGVGRFFDRKILWDYSDTNELTDHQLNEYTPCTNQTKGMECGDLFPLCFSFKPKQKEFVWDKELQWETRRRDSD